ncbi:MBL fold metallo-hydrolase [Yoonia sp. R2331]|uniref:MBL fold metallo-hydrolase n=1 Tax=Yoonia sp. R2331 TaxID=3237238 RepID=UPI0034E44319
MSDEIGQPVTVSPGVLRIRAGNPSPMTYTGTNSYVVATGDALTIIDPGPMLPDHQDALLSAVAGRNVTQIIVTHSHLDHAPLARPLADVLQCPVVAFGPSDAGRSAVMQTLAASGLAGGGEGVDPDFAPDKTVANGDTLPGGFSVLHTPGHMGNHIAIAWRDVAFTGDLVMGWASSLVSPPDGDLTDFMASCHLMLQRPETTYHPGHGDPVLDPKARLQWLIDHRNARSEQIVAALQTGPMTPVALTSLIYTDVPKAMHPAAARNVFAHLVDLTGKDRVQPNGPLSQNSTFALC